MKKLLVYLRPYRLQAILAPCFKQLELSLIHISEPTRH